MGIYTRPIRASVKGPLQIKSADLYQSCKYGSSEYCIVKVNPTGNINKNWIYVRIAHFLDIKGNTALLEYLDGTKFSLPITSDRIYAQVYKKAISEFGNKAFPLWDLVGNINVVRWNSNADFRVWDNGPFVIDGINMQCLHIYDMMTANDSEGIYTPICPRLSVNEIFKYFTPGKEPQYGKILKVTTDNMTLPAGKLPINSYRVILSNPETSTQEWNTQYLVRDFWEDGHLYMKKIPMTLQTDIRRKLFDPFYRMGGI